MAGPLAGIKILEVTAVVLGPFACQMLADMGAEVIKVEPPHGDSNRALGASRNPGMSALYLTCNRNKRSIVLDLKQKSGREALLKLASEVDVMIHNNRPQVMTKLGIDYDTIKELNPNIIYCGAYGYGKEGPYGTRGALDDSIQAVSGIAMLNEMVMGEPRYLPTVLADKTTAMAVVNAVTAALFSRERTGEGQEIEVPMFESMVSFMMTEHLWGQTFEPPIGNAEYVRLTAKHRRPYKTLDGQYLAVLPYWDNHWETFCRLCGREELAADSRFTDMATRLKNIDESYRVTGEIISSRSRADWVELLGDTNVPMMVVNTLDDLITDPQLVESGFWQEFDHSTEGRIRMSSPPINFSKTPAAIGSLPPRLGEHSAEVLLEVGMSCLLYTSDAADE